MVFGQKFENFLSFYLFKKRKLKKLKIGIFLKGIVHGFWSKI